MKLIIDKKDISIAKKYVIKRGKYFMLYYCDNNVFYRSQMFNHNTNLSDLFKYTSKISYKDWIKRLNDVASRRGRGGKVHWVVVPPNNHKILSTWEYELYEIEKFEDIESVIIMQELVG